MYWDLDIKLEKLEVVRASWFVEITEKDYDSEEKNTIYILKGRWETQFGHESESGLNTGILLGLLQKVGAANVVSPASLDFIRFAFLLSWITVIISELTRFESSKTDLSPHPFPNNLFATITSRFFCRGSL